MQARTVSETVKGPLDLTGAIIEFEQGELSQEDTLQLFGHLVATGLAWKLQGTYGRTAARLIEGGYLSKTGEVLRDVSED